MFLYQNRPERIFSWGSIVGTRMRSTTGSFKINRALTVCSVKWVLYCTVRWIVLCIFAIRAGREGWTGYSSCTFDHLSTCMSHASPPRVPLSLVQRHRSQQHRQLLYFYHILGVLLEGADASRQVEIDVPILHETDTNVAWTGSEEANDYFYMMDRTGSEVKGQAWH